MLDALTINTYFGDHQYIETMGFRLLQGRNFNQDLVSDTASVILNESAVQALGINSDPIGAEVNKGIKVIGVVHNFHWESLRTVIGRSDFVFRSSTMAFRFCLPYGVECMDVFRG